MRATRLGSLALTLALAGCAFDEDDLRAWRQAKDGDRRLAGYLADPERELPLRVLASSLLLETKAVAHILGVVHDARSDDRQRLLPGIAAQAVLVLEGASSSPAERAAALDLGYHLLRYAAELDAERADALATAVAERALDPAGEAPDGGRDRFVLAAAVARPAAVVPLLLERMAAADDLGPVVSGAALLGRLKDADALREAAAILLVHARKRYPDLPVTLARALVANGNETLLRFLLAAARDPRVPMAVRQMALAEGVDALGRDAVPDLMALLAAEDAVHGNDLRWSALNRLWELTDVAGLRDALHALPPNGDWPRVGESFKAEVDLFCDQRVARQKAAAQPVLTGLLTDNNWVARVFAFECVVRLYPDEAPRLLAGLRDDETPLPGWSADGQPTTIGAVVRRLAAN